MVLKFKMGLLFWATFVARQQTRAFSSMYYRSSSSLSSSPATLFVCKSAGGGGGRSSIGTPTTATTTTTTTAAGLASLKRRQFATVRLFSTAIDLDELNDKIKAKGDEIRQLKADGIEKDALAPHIAELLALKAQLPESDNDDNSPPKKEKKKKQQPQQEAKKKGPSPKKEEELSESELRLNRLAKVDAMRQANVEPFEYTYNVNRSSKQLNDEYTDRLEPGEEDEESDIAVAGRIMTRRVFGKLAFFTLQDETGTIQLQFDKGRLGDSFKVCLLLSIFATSSSS